MPPYNWDEKLVKKLNEFNSYFNEVWFELENKDLLVTDTKIDLIKWRELLKNLYANYIK